MWKSIQERVLDFSSDFQKSYRKPAENEAEENAPSPSVSHVPSFKQNEDNMAYVRRSLTGPSEHTLSIQFLHACENGKVEMVQAVLTLVKGDKLKELLDYTDERNIFPLLAAAQNGHLKIVDLLIQARAELSSTATGGVQGYGRKTPGQNRLNDSEFVDGNYYNYGDEASGEYEILPDDVDEQDATFLSFYSAWMKPVGVTLHSNTAQKGDNSKQLSCAKITQAPCAGQCLL